MSSPDQKGPGKDEQALADVATEAFARQKQLYDPMISKYSAIATDTAGTRARLSGSGNVATQQAFSGAAPHAVGSALSRGGSVSAALGGLESGKTQSAANTQAATVGQAKDVSSSQLGSLIGFGRGEAVQAAGGLGETAQRQQAQSERDALLSEQQKGQYLSAAASVAGYGAGAFQGYQAQGAQRSAELQSTIGEEGSGVPSYDQANSIGYGRG